MATTKIPAEFLSTNAIQGTLIADNAITTVHIAQNAITSVQIPNNSIGTVQIALNTVTGVHIAQNTITTTQLANNSVNTLNIADDQVTAAKLASDAVVTASIVDLNVTEGKIAANAITASKIPDGSITATQIGANAVTLAKMASLTRGSILLGNSAADVAALAIGSNGTILKSDGTDAAWAADGALPLAGGTMSGNLTITKAAPIIHMRATGSGSDSELKFQTASNGRGMYLDESDSNKLKIYDGSGKGTAGEFTIDNTGQVGIGTTSPAAKLDVSGVFQFFDDTTPEIKIIDSDDSNYALLSYSDGTINLSSNHGNESGGADVIKFSTGGTERARVDNDGVNVTGIIKENSIPTRSRSIAMAMTWG